MNRYRALWIETWWLWIVLAVFGVVMTIGVSWIFLVTFPISLFTFFWFGFVRYDEDGNFKGS
ncbi:MAG: hypothetical protein R3C53_20410 [Pirellulaceae bacterium]